MNETDIQYIADNISNSYYKENHHAVKELVKLLDKIHKINRYGFFNKKPLVTARDYVDAYDNNFYTYETWEGLVDSEKDQNDGLTEDELKKQIGITVWKLPCGIYVQYV